MKENILLCWSGGKDSALALSELAVNPAFSVTGLLVTLTQDYGRISMHGVRETLLDMQAQQLGYSLEKVYIGKHADNSKYEAKMRDVLLKQKEKGLDAVAFGDIFLEDVRQYRINNLRRLGIPAKFPLWGKKTKKLADDFLAQGFKAFITCVDSRYLDRSFAGREFDAEFIRDLPKDVDPCGENGEFHSFVYAGPIFGRSLDISPGKLTLREGRFWYCDLLGS